MADLRLLADLISKAGLMDTPFSAMTKEDVENVLTSAYSAGAVPDKETKFDPPYIHDGVLIIPFSSDPKYHWWKRCGQTCFETLRELNAPEEVVEKYLVGPHRRALTSK